MEGIIQKLKCFLFKHDEDIAISFKTGAWATYCKRCGKVFEESKQKESVNDQTGKD